MFEQMARDSKVEIVLAEFMPPPDRFFVYYSPETRGIRKAQAFVDAVKQLA